MQHISNRKADFLAAIIPQENKNNIIYSTILLPRVTSSAILESTQERIWRNKRCLRLGESVCMRCDTF